MNRILRAVCVMTLVAFTSALVPCVALAQASRTVYVDDTGMATAAGSGKCGKPNYASIQAAVNDMSVAHIIVCAGTYAEQVRVSRSLTLEGRSGAVVQSG